ncbi:hypothetical protein DP939_44095 [Spongiactinospora rosea]|uniref:Uncharacterized protein n=1 Tax=Spongiactinospora rosea TaxID=2248750 RepID=A0A366LJA1_9ACTN|nr:hypothetical protein [Spongiactinospora rosea]RBQ13820.1 hypothetical protein DP939_44095 [Spongiactinospora rosea]
MAVDDIIRLVDIHAPAHPAVLSSLDADVSSANRLTRMPSTLSSPLQQVEFTRDNSTVMTAAANGTASLRGPLNRPLGTPAITVVPVHDQVSIPDLMRIALTLRHGA